MHPWITKKLLPIQVVTGGNAATRINTSMSCLIPELVGFGTTLAKREKKISRPEVPKISWYLAKKIDLLLFFCSAHSSVSGHQRVCSSVQASSKFWLHKIFPHFSFTLLLSFLNIPFLSGFLFYRKQLFSIPKATYCSKVRKAKQIFERILPGELVPQECP